MSTLSREQIFLTIATFLLTSVVAVETGCLPTAIPYPETGWDFNTIVDGAKQRSDDLAAYIDDWFDGNVGGNVPVALVPDGADQTYYPKESWVLIPEDKIADMNQQVCTYPIKGPNGIGDFNSLGHFFHDPHAAYMVNWYMWIPYGHKVEIKGKFPHCRFFSIQLTPPFEPYVYRTGYDGVNEVPIADVDIEPDSGHVNPFRSGANRDSTMRNYTVTFEMKMGRQVDFDANVVPRPENYFRGKGNLRYGGAIMYGGPWNDPNCTDNPIKSVSYGRWKPGDIWIRYYGPDKAYEPYGGEKPSITYQRGNGSKYFIKPNVDGLVHATNYYYKSPGAACAAAPAGDEYKGWLKLWGILYNLIQGAGENLGLKGESDYKYYRDLYLGASGRGVSQPGVGSWEATATCVPYYSLVCTTPYFANSNSVNVLTGRLLTYPDTRNGLSTMSSGSEVRYWSIGNYDNSYTQDPNIGLADPNWGAGTCLSSTLDDEVVIDANRRYAIVYSHQDFRPTNAYSANGVTWRSVGKHMSNTGFVTRWVSMYPDFFTSFNPHDLTWNKTDRGCTFSYDPNLIGLNRQDKAMGWFLPKRHILTKEEFEALGSVINPETIPIMRNSSTQQWIAPVGWSEVYSTTTFAGGDANIVLSSTSGRYVMVECITPQGWESVYEIMELKVLDSSGTNLAAGKVTRSSCYQTEWWGSQISSFAVDGVVDYEHSWTSKSGNATAWIYVDLGAKYNLSKVYLQWPNGVYPQTSKWATAYKVSVADTLR